MSGAPDAYAAFSAPVGGGDAYAAISSPTAGPKKKRSLLEDASGFMAKVNRGLGIGDELAAAGMTVADAVSGKRPDYKASLARQRGIEDSFGEAHPHVAALATGTGNALTMAAPIGPGAEAFATGGRAINALRGATVAGLTGAGYAAVDRGSLPERAAAAASAAHDPLTLGLGAAAGASAAVRPKAVKAPAPSLEQLTADKNAAYARVRDSGETYSADQFRSLMDEVTANVAKEGFSAGSHPKAAAKLDYLSDLAHRAADEPLSLERLDDLRHQIGRDVAASPDPGERRMGTIMRNTIDGFIEKAGGSPDLLSARDLNTRVSKLTALNEFDDTAARRAARTGSGGNKENALRQNVDKFIDDTGNLTPAEDATARKVVMGTSAGNALRQVGKLSPAGNGLGLTVHTVGAIGSHGATLPVAGLGFVSKKVSEAITNGHVRALRELIASGGQVAQEVSRQLADPVYAELRQQLANDLAGQAGVQGTARRRPAVTVEALGPWEQSAGASSSR